MNDISGVAAPFSFFMLFKDVFLMIKGMTYVWRNGIMLTVNGQENKEDKIKYIKKQKGYDKWRKKY